MKSYDIGIAGEESAVLYLEKHGYEIISRRTRIGHSEVDIISRDKRDGTVVFVEVKTRRTYSEISGFYRSAGAAVDAKKQAYLTRAAEEYMRSHPNESVRIDVIEVYVDPVPDGDTYRVNDIIHTENAVKKAGKFSLKNNRY